MSSQGLSLLAAIFSAIATVAAMVVAIVSLRDSRIHARRAALLDEQHLEAALQARLDPLYPGLRGVLGTVDDGVPREVRDVLIPFFVLYADAFAAHRDGLLSKSAWAGLGTELANWAQKERGRRAWQIFRKQEWTEGFVDYVDEVMAGPRAYPGMDGVSEMPPTVPWD